MLTLIYSSLVVLCLGLVTSMSLLGGFHILIALPTIYIIPRLDFKKIPKSAWALLVFTVIIILSILVNHDVSLMGYKALGKVKYFLIGFFSIAPFYYLFQNNINDKKVKILLYTFCIATTFATIAGIVSMKTGYNFITAKTVSMERNAGLSGMILNYAHNLAFFQILILGLILFKDVSKKYINSYFLCSVFFINFVGLYLTYTRGALLALFVAIPFYFFKKYKKRFLIICASLGVAALALYFVSGQNIIRPGSDRLRLSMWKTAVKAFEERPFTGYGYLNFELHSREIKKRYQIEEPTFGGHAHNNFLEVMATTGIFGLVSFIAWIVLWFIEVYKREDLVAKITLPFIIAFIVGGLTQATIALGVNLFFIMGVYSISQAAGSEKILKETR